MSLFKIKVVLASICKILFISEYKLKKMNEDPNFVRIVNYHETPKESMSSFEKQLKWYKDRFSIINYGELKEFLNGSRSFTDKPGLLLTFDDGKKSNYDYGRTALSKYGVKGVFFVSSDLVGSEGYMSWDEIKKMTSDGHTIGCHTATHHRMEEDDTIETLRREIITSKKTIENNLGEKIDSFCWCGGEEQHYTKKAGEMIKSEYSYSFLTNSFPVFHGTNPFLLERTNIEALWGIPLVLFQLCGFIDIKHSDRRKRVEALVI